MAATKPNRDHHALVKAGLKLHEAHRYTQALRRFDAAALAAPACPLVAYNRANTLHMLGHEAEAYSILRQLIRATPEKLQEHCPDFHPLSLQLDAYYLLFLVTLYHRGFCPEAFNYAEEHLRRRRRGLPSLWTLRDVRATISSLRREWSESQLKHS